MPITSYSYEQLKELLPQALSSFKSADTSSYVNTFLLNIIDHSKDLYHSLDKLPLDQLSELMPVFEEMVQWIKGKNKEIEQSKTQYGNKIDVAIANVDKELTLWLTLLKLQLQKLEKEQEHQLPPILVQNTGNGSSSASSLSSSSDTNLNIEVEGDNKPMSPKKLPEADANKTTKPVSPLPSSSSQLTILGFNLNEVAEQVLVDYLLAQIKIPENNSGFLQLFKLSELEILCPDFSILEQLFKQVNTAPEDKKSKLITSYQLLLKEINRQQSEYFRYLNSKYKDLIDKPDSKLKPMQTKLKEIEDYVIAQYRQLAETVKTKVPPVGNNQGTKPGEPPVKDPTLSNQEEKSKKTEFEEKRTKLISIIESLKANIKCYGGEPGERRKTNWYSKWKTDLLQKIVDNLNKEPKDADNIQKYIQEARKVCALRRNFWHIWKAPHSLAEFEKGLGIQKLVSEESSESLSLE